MGAQHMLRNKMKLGIVDEPNVLRLSRRRWPTSGVVVAKRHGPLGAAGPDGLSGRQHGARRPAT